MRLAEQTIRALTVFAVLGICSVSPTLLALVVVGGIINFREVVNYVRNGR